MNRVHDWKLRDLSNPLNCHGELHEIARDALAYRRALKRIVKLGESAGHDTKELDMVAIAKRAIGRTT